MVFLLLALALQLSTKEKNGHVKFPVLSDKGLHQEAVNYNQIHQVLVTATAKLAKRVTDLFSK